MVESSYESALLYTIENSSHVFKMRTTQLLQKWWGHWIARLLRLRFQFYVSSFLFLFFFHAFQGDKFYCSHTIHALFTGPITTLFRKKNIKNESHGTIYIFKNYFVTVFSVLIFNNINCIQMDLKCHKWCVGEKLSSLSLANLYLLNFALNRF